MTCESRMRRMIENKDEKTLNYCERKNASLTRFSIGMKFTQIKPK